MKRNRLAYMASGLTAGLVLALLGWGFGNFYLVVAGVILIAAALASLTMPMPILP